MKITLILFICSYVAGNCLPPHQWPEKFDDMYDCFNAGYIQSMNKLEEIGKSEVDKHGLYLKFECTQLIIPKKKPIGQPT